MILVAATPDGQYLQQNMFIDDPSPEQVSIEPNGTVDGSIELHKRFKGIDAAVAKSDIHLFWAYKIPDELGGRGWSGGWTLIPKVK